MSLDAPDAAPAAGDAFGGTVDSPRTFATALLGLVRAAHARQARRLVCTDPDFDGWPLEDDTLLAALDAWLRLPQRRLVLAAAQFDALARRSARFAAWRRVRAHAVDTLQCDEADRATLPSLALDDGPLVLVLADRPRWRGHAARDPHEARRWRDATDAVLQRSQPAWPPTTLGL